MTEPKLTHELLVQATAAAGDRVLAELTATPASYYTKAVPFPALTQVRVFRVVPLESSQPLDWLVAVARERPEATVLTLHPAGVGKVILADPTARTLADLPRLVYELSRPRAVATSFVDQAERLPAQLRSAFAPPVASASAQGVAGRFQVLDEGRLYAWSYDFRPDNYELRKQELAAGGAP